MPLIDQVKAMCDRLAPMGWRDLLQAVTAHALDIQRPTSAALQAELTKNLPSIDRTAPGFEDYFSGGQQAISAGQPSQSLLYHALASPLVIRDHLGAPLGGFATPAELDALENYIFSLAEVNLSQFLAQNGAAKVAVVVFSSDYRVAATSVDGRQADLSFARTGIARVGTAEPSYLPEARSFWLEDDDNAHNIRVLPARFSAWLAVKKKGAATRVSPILDNDEGQAVGEGKRDFWAPVHKLFAGTECLAGMDLQLEFQATLFNLKIQRIHRFLKTSPLPTGFPYVIRDAEIASVATAPDLGPGWLVPKVRPRLVDPAIIDGIPITYRVSRKNVDTFAAFEGVPDTDNLGLPAYVHARTRVQGKALEDLNDQLDVVAAMKKPASYDALHYIDYTGEGWMTVASPQLAQSQLKILPAYVLVSAPDFFPSSGQFELSEWSRSKQLSKRFRDALWNVKPTPLSEIRLPANVQLPNSPFDINDATITAVVGMGAPTGTPSMWPAQPNIFRTTSLPDDAAGVFAPGWDVSKDQTAAKQKHLAGYGLGSPFPEDAKLCAALSTFWPAVAPDVYRTFVHIEMADTNGTIAPLTDEEIGQAGTLPLDGIPGPRVIQVAGQPFVQFPSFLNADYVQQAVQNRFSIRLTSRINDQEYQRRMLASCRVYSVLANLGEIPPARDQWLLLSFREVSSGDSALQAAQAEAGTILMGQVYAARVCRVTPVVTPKTDAHLDRMPLVDDRQFFASADSIMVLVKRATDPAFAAAPSEP